MIQSCCVVSRICETELPYINSFISHYVSLGFDNIYFVNHKISQYQAVVNYINKHPHANICTVIPVKIRKGFRTNKLQNFAISHINDKFDYVLGVDCDEYLQLDQKYSDIKQYVQRHSSYRAHHFMWCYMVSDSDGKINCCMRDKWQGGRVKSMIKLTNGTLRAIPIHGAVPLHKYIRSKNNVYGGILPNMGKGKVKFFEEEARLYHYWGRSFNDFVLKSTEQSGLAVGNKNLGGVAGLERHIRDNILPARFVGLANFNLFKIHDELLPRNEYMAIDTQLEYQQIQDRVSEVTYNNIKNMYQVYKEYITNNPPGLKHPYNVPGPKSKGKKFTGPVSLDTLT